MTLRASIDIGTSGVRIVESSVGARSISVKRAAAQPLPPGFVNEDGTIEDKDAVAGVLKSLWRKNRFRARQITVVISADRSYLIRGAQLDYQSNAKVMEGIVSSNAQAILSRDPHTMQVDHHIVRVSEVLGSDDQVTQKADVLVVGADRATLDSVLETVSLAGIIPTSVDVAPFALARFVSASTSKSSYMDFVLHIGASTVSLVGIINGQYVSHQSMDSYSGSAVTNMIKDFLSGGTWEAAEEIKTNPLGKDGQMSSEDAEARQNIAAMADVFVRESAEIITSITRNQGVPVRNVWLSGGGSRMAGLVGRLGNEEALADANVSLLRPQAWVNGADKIEDVVEKTGQDVTLAVAASGK